MGEAGGLEARAGGACPEGAGSWLDLEPGSPASRVCEAWWATGSIRRSRSSSRRRMPAGASRGRSWWAMTDAFRPRVFAAAVEAGVMATGHDVLFAGPTATPTIGWLVRRPGGCRRHPDLGFAQSAQYNGLKFFQRAGMVLSSTQGQAMLDRWQKREFRWASWDALGRRRVIDDPDRGHLAAVLGIVDVPAITSRGFKVVLDACHGAGGRLGRSLLEALGCRSRRRRAASPTAVTTTRPSRPRPTCKSLARSCRPSGPRSVSPRTPMPTGWRSSTRTAAISAKS